MCVLLAGLAWLLIVVCAATKFVSADASTHCQGRESKLIQIRGILIFIAILAIEILIRWLTKASVRIREEPPKETYPVSAQPVAKETVEDGEESLDDGNRQWKGEAGLKRSKVSFSNLSEYFEKYTHELELSRASERTRQEWDSLHVLETPESTPFIDPESYQQYDLNNERYPGNHVPNNP